MNQNSWKMIYSKYKINIAVAAILAVMMAVVLQGCGKDAEPAPDEAAAEVPAETAAEAEPENVLEENSHASIDRLIERYLTAITEGDVDSLESMVDVLTDEEKESVQSRAVFYESFDNLVCYTKNGPTEDSYIVFVCYDRKLIGIETPAPDIICLYVSPKDEEGNRYIHYGEIDEELHAFVAELEKDPEVKALYDDVSARYQEAMESDKALKEYIQRVTGQVTEEEEAPEEETPEEEASAEETPEEEASAEETPEEEAAAEETPEETPAEEASEEEPEAEAAVQNRETRVTESVNVRKEASTESERLALAYQGDPITQIESYEDGWSKVEYKGLTGYVKTEFLE
ncbi:MAG: SH3 domain-containing protein [Clostridiales bacterium]|nr:SH3 domain-containing protein [Clostridiales bacterium]